MTAQLPPPGWYPDPTGKAGQKYWDGRQWNAAPPPQTPPVAPSSAPVPPGGAAPLAGPAASAGLDTAKGLMAKMSTSAWLILGGLVVALIAGIFLPFFSANVEMFGVVASSHNTPAVKFVIVVLVAVALWLAWPIFTGSAMTTNRFIGLFAVIGLLILGAIIDAAINGVFSGGDEFSSVGPGFGMLLYGLAVAVAAVGAVLAWLQKPATTHPTFEHR